MNKPLPISGNLSESCPVRLSWEDWARLNAPFDYRSTGSELSPQPIPKPSKNLVVGTMLFAAASTGMASNTGWAAVVGTGGTAANMIKQGQPSTTSWRSPESLIAEIDERASGVRISTDEGAKVLGGADLIAEIKAVLGVNVTDLAAIARVSRQAIYDWIGEGQVSEANYERLLALRQLCLDWQSRATRPLGRLLHVKNTDKRSLLDLLEQDPLDRTLIELQLDALAAKAAEQEQQRSSRKARLSPLSEKDQHENVLTHAIPAMDS
jgi:hypothetical protein